ncbi:protein of unknown function [Acidithiobacillus ferrivorans]|uniref:Uncharacterized protein n=1 Tax=Acidithiobacillus ferrivorans TaxID=160808 RepID=A0ABY1MKC2_9PROT|nr:protein of unknown function [Acidithiobacillus ferrivorans]
MCVGGTVDWQSNEAKRVMSAHQGDTASGQGIYKTPCPFLQHILKL